MKEEEEGGHTQMEMDGIEMGQVGTLVSKETRRDTILVEYSLLCKVPTCHGTK